MVTHRFNFGETYAVVTSHHSVTGNDSASGLELESDLAYLREITKVKFDVRFERVKSWRPICQINV